MNQRILFERWSSSFIENWRCKGFESLLLVLECWCPFQTKSPLLIFKEEMFLQFCYAFQRGLVPEHLAYFSIYALLSQNNIIECSGFGGRRYCPFRYTGYSVLQILDFSLGHWKAFFGALFLSLSSDVHVTYNLINVNSRSRQLL